MIIYINFSDVFLEILVTSSTNKSVSRYISSNKLLNLNDKNQFKGLIIVLELNKILSSDIVMLMRNIFLIEIPS